MVHNYDNLPIEQIVQQYNFIVDFHKKFLGKFGVKLPELFGADKKFTKNALVLIYLSIGYPKTKVISKTELTHFMREFYPDTADVQQARHLGAQDDQFLNQ